MFYGKLTRSIAIVFCAAVSIASGSAQSNDEAPLADDLIHSELPLFAQETTEKWPQHFYDDDGGFGCLSRVAFGDWALRRSEAEADDEPSGYRFANYGVFHCAALVSTAAELKELDKETPRISFFVSLGSIRTGNRKVELWAIQIGARPGSDYVLLTRSPGPGLISSFSVLQRDCPKSNRRKAPEMDSFRTDYCAIDSRPALIALARRMANRQPLGTLVMVHPPKEEE